ncbi:Hypothetical protein GbCGDNIH8_8723 [Granulibacter bethesdensis]|nr:Hypothetical protein GbCGDNIH8_8723 [Granulibacter bethesdensis]
MSAATGVACSGLQAILQRPVVARRFLSSGSISSSSEHQIETANRPISGLNAGACGPEKRVRTIPAHAGEPRAQRGHCGPYRDYPRARGGTRMWRRGIQNPGGLSPRTRGNQETDSEIIVTKRTIPAHAGEPTMPEVVAAIVRDYPRARGGTPPAEASQQNRRGLSPRTRGNPTSAVVSRSMRGTIPAHAGEPLDLMLLISKNNPNCSHFEENASRLFQRR